MDRTDLELIAALRVDGRASFAELGRKVGLSSSTAHERVGKLEASGVIAGYRAVLAPGALGESVTAVVGIEASENGRDDVIAAALDDIPPVVSCWAVAGDEAFVVLVRVANVDELYACLGRLRAIDGVARTRTTVVLATKFEDRPAR